MRAPAQHATLLMPQIYSNMRQCEAHRGIRSLACGAHIVCPCTRTHMSPHAVGPKKKKKKKITCSACHASYSSNSALSSARTAGQPRETTAGGGFSRRHRSSDTSTSALMLPSRMGRSDVYMHTSFTGTNAYVYMY